MTLNGNDVIAIFCEAHMLPPPLVRFSVREIFERSSPGMVATSTENDLLLNDVPIGAGKSGMSIFAWGTCGDGVRIEFDALVVEVIGLGAVFPVAGETYFAFAGIDLAVIHL